MGFRPDWDEAKAKKDMASGLIKVRPFTSEQVQHFKELAAEVDGITDRLSSPAMNLMILPSYGEIYKHNPCPHQKGYLRHQCIECGIAWLQELAIGLLALEAHQRQGRNGERSFKELLPN